MKKKDKAWTKSVNRYRQSQEFWEDTQSTRDFGTTVPFMRKTKKTKEAKHGK